jgi:hypothetical protein
MGIRRAWTLALAGLLLFLAPASADVFRVEDLAGGINDSAPGHLIGDNEASAISNFRIDPFSRALIQREGSSRLNATQLTGKKAVDVHTYVQQDGDEFLLAFSSRTVNYSSNNGSTWTTLVSTATDGAINDCTNFIDDKLYCVSQNDGGFRFDGSTFFTTTQTPAGKYIEAYQNRLWVANTSANPGRLFFSGLLLGATYTISTDYIDFPAPITGIGKPYDGGLPVYTDNQTWMVRGSAPSNFYVQQISDVIGAAHNRTIQNFNLLGHEYQIFLSKGVGQTENNLFALNGVSVQPVGNKVKNTLAGVNIGNVSARSQVWDTSADFDAGTYTKTNSTRTSGQVRIDQWATDLVDDFTDGNYTSNPAWTPSNAASISVTTAIIFTPTISTNETVYTTDISSQTNGQWSWRMKYLENGPNDTIKFRFINDGVNPCYDISLFLGSNVMDLRSNNSTVGASSTTPTANVWHDFVVKKDGSSFTISVDGSEFTRTDTASYTNSRFELFYRRESGSTGELHVDDIYEPWIGTARYVSQKIQADASLSAWGAFEASYAENGGTMQFQVKVATSSAMLDSTPFQNITPGAQISTTTGQWVQWAASMTITNVSQNINIDQVTLNWTSGSGASQPLGSAVFDGDYWLTYTGSDESRNQSILLMNREGAFSTLSGINAYSLAVERGRLFAGDSTTDTVNGGYVWELETGSTDNGTAVTAQVTLKNQQFPQGDDYEKNLAHVYFNYAVTAGTFTATVLENFSEYSTDYTIQFGTGTLYNRWKLEANQQSTGRHFGLRFTNSYSGSRLRLYPPITYHFEKVRLIPQ